MFKFKINYSFIIVLIIVFLSPKQSLLLKLLFCLIIHEIGHLSFIYLFGVKINSLVLYSTGFFMDIEENDLLFKESFLIYLGGILFNIILLFLNINKDINNICFLLIIINSLPIYPLDGYQILKKIIELFLPVYYAESITDVLSLMGIIFLIFIGFYYRIDLFIIFNMVYLMGLLYKHIKDKKIRHYKFLLHKYLNYKERKYKEISFKDKYERYIYRYKNIKMKIGGKRIYENELLMSIFK